MSGPSTSPASSSYVRNAVVALALVACGSKGGAGSKPLAVEVTTSAQLGEDPDADLVRYEVSTTPGAMVTIRGTGAIALDGKEIELQGVAGGDGKVTLEQKVWNDDAATHQVFVSVLRLADGQTIEQPVTAVRPSRLAPYRAGWHCIAKDKTCYVELVGGELVLTEAPAGTVLRVGERSAPIEGEQARVSVGPGAELLGSPVPFSREAYTDDLGQAEEAAFRLAVPVAVEFADGVKVPATVKLGARFVRAALISAVAAGPGAVTRYEGEAEVGPGKGVLYMKGARARVIGSAETIGEIGAFASETHQERSVRCGTYGGASGSVTGTGTAFDATVKVWDRRTGKLLGEKAFKASADPCKSEVLAGKGDQNVSAGTSHADPAAIEKWVATFTR